MFNLLPIFDKNIVLFLSKVIFVILDASLTVYLFIVYKQVASMNNIIEDVNIAIVIKSFAFILLMITISLFLAIFFIP